MKYINLNLVFLLSMASLTCAAETVTASTKKDTVVYGLDIERIFDSAHITFRFCPDNTCEEFSTQNIGKITVSRFAQLFSLYLLYWSEYAVLENSICEIDSQSAKKLLNAIAVKQAILGNNIQLSIISFDEQDSTSAPLDISEITKKRPRSFQNCKKP